MAGVKKDNDALFLTSHWHTLYAVCPYCGYELQDSWELADGTDQETDCPNCERVFGYERDVEVSYTTWEIEEAEPCRA